MLAEGASLAEGLFSIDAWIYPELKVEVARLRYGTLCQTVGERVRERGHADLRVARPDVLVRDILEVLRDDGFTCVDPKPARDASRADAKVFSQALLERRASCGTMSLLALACLESQGGGGFAVCMPDHCFVRVPTTGGTEDIECTTYGASLDEPEREATLRVSERARAMRMHYGKSLGRKETLWHYLGDSLGAWLRRPDTDGAVLAYLSEAKEILGGSCLSFESQEARRLLRLARANGISGEARESSLLRARGCLSRMFDWDPSEAAIAINLALLWLERREISPALEVLGGFVRSTPLSADPTVLDAYCLWYTTRLESGDPAYRFSGADECRRALFLLAERMSPIPGTPFQATALSKLGQAAGSGN
ncbi:MAG TPA: hypothetical protein VEN81_14415 [Planctomycetota bacterium]|nr:hypothetical protein [Planctomycetota bacterium]